MTPVKDYTKETEGYVPRARKHSSDTPDLRYVVPHTASKGDTLEELKELVYASAECHDEKSRRRILDIAFRQYEERLVS